MLQPRLMPCLLLRNAALVKTIRFRDPAYVGDPTNAIRIYNEKEVDELILLDITATPDSRPPNLKLLASLASECFMPMAYGGGVRSVSVADSLFSLGIEKVVVNTHAVERPELVTELAEHFGSQAVVVSIDAKRSFFGRYEVMTAGGRRASGLDPVSHARAMADRGAGEILLTAIDRDGTGLGYDLDLLNKVTTAVTIPVVASGGAGNLEHCRQAIRVGGASAAALGSMAVYHGRNRAVLIGFPDRAEIDAVLDSPGAPD